MRPWPRAREASAASTDARILPQNKRFFYRVFFALKPPACDGLADERFLVGGEAHIHSLNVGIPGGRVNATEVDGDALLPVLAVTDLQGWMDGRVTTMPAEEQRQVFAIPCDLSACKLGMVCLLRLCYLARQRMHGGLPWILPALTVARLHETSGALY